MKCESIIFHSPSHVQLLATPWTAACQAPLSSSISRSLLKLMSVDLRMPSNHLIMCCPLLLLPQFFPASGAFSMSRLFTWSGQGTGASASTLVFPMNIQSCFPWGLIGLVTLHSKWLSRVFFNNTVQKHQFFGFQPSLWSSYHICTWLLTSVHDYWKNHSFDCMDLCRQSDVSDF